MSGQSFSYGDINVEGGNAQFGNNYAILNIIANDGIEDLRELNEALSFVTNSQDQELILQNIEEVEDHLEAIQRDIEAMHIQYRGDRDEERREEAMIRERMRAQHKEEMEAREDMLREMIEGTREEWRHSRAQAEQLATWNKLAVGTTVAVVSISNSQKLVGLYKRAMGTSAEAEKVRNDLKSQGLTKV
ncbi:hypothetical protein HYFRA_00002359 [Hymenoscyphus fraxineus]|uniref:Uncharacterized protein n=1 Tax=Hymenoscyphus fraxineus TaxID=746836 RepID=A0A9N9LC96_9HELO|nr:hypothetical protein HYFRA_00002359 [Hymenoscyphus fraxineus]